MYTDTRQRLSVDTCTRQTLSASTDICQTLSADTDICHSLAADTSVSDAASRYKYLSDAVSRYRSYTARHDGAHLCIVQGGAMELTCVSYREARWSSPVYRTGRHDGAHLCIVQGGTMELTCVAQRAGVGRLAVGGQYSVRLGHLLVFYAAFGTQVLAALPGSA